MTFKKRGGERNEPRPNVRRQEENFNIVNYLEYKNFSLCHHNNRFSSNSSCCETLIFRFFAWFFHENSDFSSRDWLISSFFSYNASSCVCGMLCDVFPVITLMKFKFATKLEPSDTSKRRNSEVWKSDLPGSFPGLFNCSYTLVLY